MKKRFTEEQIIGFLREAEAGLPVAELCRRHGFSEASYYLWRNKFGGMLVVRRALDPVPVALVLCVVNAQKFHPRI